MSDIVYQRVIVQHTSLETLEESGVGFGDDGLQSAQYAGEIDKEHLLSFLTERQRAVVTLLSAGYDRRYIAKNLGISMQAVHQIVPRIRKRLHQKAGIPLKGWRRKYGSY